MMSRVTEADETASDDPGVVRASPELAMLSHGPAYCRHSAALVPRIPMDRVTALVRLFVLALLVSVVASACKSEEECTPSPENDYCGAEALPTGV